MWGLPSIISLFHNEYNKFNNTVAQMLNSFYHRILKLLQNCMSGMKMSRFCNLLHDILMGKWFIYFLA